MAKEIEQEEMRTFTQKDSMGLVVLVVEDTKLYVLREVLAHWSPVFKTMFESEGFKEAKEKKVELPDKKLEDIQLLLNCLLFPLQFKVTDENVMRLLPLVEEYQIALLKDECEKVLLSFKLTGEILGIAHKYSMSTLLNQCIARCATLPLSQVDHERVMGLLHGAPDPLKTKIYKAMVCERENKLQEQKTAVFNYGKLKEIVQAWHSNAKTYCKSCASTKDQTKNSCSSCLGRFKDSVIRLVQESPRPALNFFPSGSN